MLSRWPGLMPENFSAVYAMTFCSGLYFRHRLASLALLGIVVASDMAINLFFYGVPAFHWSMLPNYTAYALIIALGRKFKPTMRWVTLLGGGLAGAVLFYFVTNTGAWLQNPEYPRTLAGWIQALTVGTPGWPHTWEFFRNTLLSGGLFTGLFVGAVKLADRSEAAEKEEDTGDEEQAPEEAKA